MNSSPFRLLRLAVRLYARPPLQRLLAPAADTDAARALGWLPMVGLLVGALFAIVYVLVAQLLPHSVAVLLALAAAVLLTGGFHESGLARFCDAASSADEQMPRTPAARGLGMLGAIALVLSFGLKLESLSSLDPSWISIAALTGQPLSRGLAVTALTGLGRRADGVRAVSTGTWLIALAGGLVPAIIAAWGLDSQIAFACGLLPAMLVMLLVRRMARRRPAADAQAVLGAGQQTSEIAWYLGLLAWWTLTGTPATETPIE